MDTWFTRDLPILAALVSHYDDPRAKHLLVDDVVALTNRDGEDVRRALAALAGAAPPYIEGVRVAGEPFPVRITGVTERARREAGQWPALAEGIATELVAQLNRMADSTDDEQQRGKFRRAADALGSIGRDIFVRVVTEVIARETGSLGSG